MIRVGIVGVSGYTGTTILELLLRHPDVHISYVSANDVSGRLQDILPQLKYAPNLEVKNYDDGPAIELCDVVFLAVPHRVAMGIAPKLIRAGKRVIDLSADYRLDKAIEYKKWYGVKHIDQANLRKAVYGLPELYRINIRDAKLIANPGCYPTAAILALAPIVSVYGADISSIIVDAKTGVSGAGRKANLSLMFCEVNENCRAYKVLKHQHTPEIDLYLSKISAKPIHIDFVPHLLPINRGILETIYVRLDQKISFSSLVTIYKRFYKTEHFVRIFDTGTQPELKNVVRSNYCDIGLEIGDDGHIAVITSAIDNLVKGAAGQAVQNMNIMYGVKEETALI